MTVLEKSFKLKTTPFIVSSGRIKNLLITTTVLAMIMGMQVSATAAFVEQTDTSHNWGLSPPHQHPDFPVQSFLAADTLLIEFTFLAINLQTSSPWHYTMVVLDDNEGNPGNVIYESELRVLDGLTQPFELALMPTAPIPTVPGIPCYVGLRPETANTGGLIIQGRYGDPYPEGMFTLIGRWHDPSSPFPHDFDAGFRAVFIPEPSTLSLLTIGGLALWRKRR